jgi:hypothetical protein
MQKNSRTASLVLIGILLGFTLLVLPASGKTKTFIDWQSLRNPVLSYPDWSIKDAALSYRKGIFYVFFSAFYSDRGQIRSHVVELSTRDFKQYSQPIFNFDGEEDGWIGMCSPDVQRVGNQYILTYNSWGDKAGKPNSLFYKTSKDLVHWSQGKTLATNLIGDESVIDAALAHIDKGFYLIWKPNYVRGARIAFTPSLDQPFTLVGDGSPSLLMAEGKDNGLFHENYEFVQTNGRWYLLTTDYVPHAPYLYALDTESGWLRWTQGYTLDIPKEDFNTVNIANASALYDWRQYDGYYYLIYAGCTERKTYAKRGWNSLGLARSKDLVHWSVAGKTE